MKNLFILVYSLVLMQATLLCQQTPDVDLSLIVSDNLGNSKELRYGLDPLATDGIDEILGEITLPPWSFAFEARFNLLPGTESTWNDYRLGAVNYAGQKIHHIQYLEGEGASSITIGWNMPNGVTGVLQDKITGTIVNVFMSDIGSYTVPFIGIRELKMTLTYDGNLPVELSSFTATNKKNYILLNWTTATEVNNFGFEVERKTDGDWQKLGYVEGHGTSNSTKEYAYIDKNPIGGKEFLYRLKQIDNDGQFKYSDIVAANLVLTEFALYQNYPNPFNPNTKIKYQLPKGCKVLIRMYDLLGAEVQELLNENKEPGIYEIEFNAENLPSGVYIYRISAGNYLNTKKMILLR